MRAYVYGAKAPIEGAELVREQLRLAHRYANRLVEIERARRAAHEAAGDDETAQRDAEEAANEAVRQARATCGVYWGTYLCVEEAAQCSRRRGGEARFRRWDGGGTLAVQLQGGISVVDLLSGTNRMAQIIGENKRRTIRLRVGSHGRDPVWAEWPIYYHRALPPDAVVKWVRMVARRIGTHHEWSAQVVLDGLPERTLPAPTRGTIAIDVGWRRFPGEGVRVAVWVDDAGETGEIRLPEEMFLRWDKVDDLRSIREQNFNAALAALREWKGGAAALPEWFREHTIALHAWRVPARLAALAVRWRDARFAGDEEVFAAVEGWRHEDKHLLEWEANQLDNVLGARREVYRIFALWAANYQRVVVEQLDLRALAERPEQRSEEDPRLRAARGRRFQAALHELFRCLADAAERSGSEWLEALAVNTTCTCAGCGSVERFDAGAEVHHVCTACGHRWDQDENAARNLQRAAMSGMISPGRRSRQKRRDGRGESAADARRAKGLATRRARRSQTTVRAPPVTDE